MNRVVALAVGLLGTCWVVAGCERAEGVREAADASVAALTASDIRAARRMYDGAPPVIPHPPLGADCNTCHTSTGRAAPPIGLAPANPHAKTAHFVGWTNCKQCHVFALAKNVYRANSFVGVGQTLVAGERLYPSAPPVMPHSLFMREDCQACHGGVASRPEIRCDHLNRVNCRQCHVVGNQPQRFESEFSPLAPGIAQNDFDRGTINDGTATLDNASARPEILREEKPELPGHLRSEDPRVGN